jgi:hypothetical protein
MSDSGGINHSQTTERQLGSNLYSPFFSVCSWRRRVGVMPFKVGWTVDGGCVTDLGEGGRGLVI